MGKRKKDVTGINVVFSMGEVKIIRKISESLNCQVYLTDRNTIVKFYDFRNEQARMYYEREVPVYQIMSFNPGLAGYLDHLVVGDEGFLHLEYYPRGDFNYIMAMKKLQVNEIRESILDICSGLEELHGKGILHMDLRPENILLSNEGITKMCDFGSSLRSDILSDLQIQGTLGEFIEKNTEAQYRSPEFRNGHPLSVGYWIDMWQLGCLLYTMINYKSPFPYGFNAPIDLSTTPKLFKGILEGLLEIRPEKRMTANQVIHLLIPNYLLTGKLSDKRVGFIEKIVARSTKQLVSRILANDEDLHAHEISRLVYKVIKKPVKISKFLEVVNEKLSDNVVQTLKILAMVHVYSFKVPILVEKFYEKLKLIIHSVAVNWTIKAAEKPIGLNTKYFAGFIKQYCRLFLMKIKLNEDRQVKFNWSNFALENENIDQVLDYFEFCIYLILGLTIDSVSEYKDLRQEIVKILINEISIVVLIFTKAFKLTIDFANQRYMKFKKLYRQIQVLCEKKYFQIFLASLPDETSLSTFKSFATATEEFLLTSKNPLF